MKTSVFVAVSLFAAGLPSTALRAEPTGRVTGVGGIFVTSKDPKALTKWYKEVLGSPICPGSGAILRYDAPGHPPMALWNAMPENSDEIAPSHRDFMINLAVDDLDAFVVIGSEAGKESASPGREGDQTGKFACSISFDPLTEQRLSFGNRLLQR